MSLLRPALVGSLVLFGIVPGAYAQQTAEGDAWMVSGGIGVSYDSNALFVDGPDGASDLAIRAQTGIRRSWTLPRGKVNLTGSLTRPFYQKTSSLSTLMYDFGGGGSYAVTQRLSWTVNTSFMSSLAQDSKVVTDTGVVLPSVVVRTGSTSTQLGYELSPRTTMTWSLSEVGVGFASTIFKRPGSDFQGGSVLSSGFTLARRLNGGQQLGLSQSYDLTFGNAGNAAIQSYLATWQASVGKNWTVSAAGGVRAYTIPGEDEYRFAPAAKAAVSMRVREGQTFGVIYERAIEQAFGLDRTHQIQTVGASYATTWGRKLSTELSASYSRGTYPLIPDLILIGELANASVAYDVFHGLALSVTSSLYVRTFTPAPAVSAYRTSLNLGYGKSWR
jgi:hypothetical protein